MPELNMREYVSWLMSNIRAEEAWAMSLGFDNADQYHREMDDHFDNIQYQEELDAHA